LGGTERENESTLLRVEKKTSLRVGSREKKEFRGVCNLAWIKGREGAIARKKKRRRKERKRERRDRRKIKDNTKVTGGNRAMRDP